MLEAYEPSVVREHLMPHCDTDAMMETVIEENPYLSLAIVRHGVHRCPGTKVEPTLLKRIAGMLGKF